MESDSFMTIYYNFMHNAVTSLNFIIINFVVVHHKLIKFDFA